MRQKHYFPSISTYVRNWVRECEVCNKDKRMNNTQITQEITHTPKCDLGHEDLMHFDQSPELPPSGGYEKSYHIKRRYFKIRICFSSVLPNSNEN